MERYGKNIATLLLGLLLLSGCANQPAKQKFTAVEVTPLQQAQAKLVAANKKIAEMEELERIAKEDEVKAKAKAKKIAVPTLTYQLSSDFKTLVGMTLTNMVQVGYLITPNKNGTVKLCTEVMAPKKSSTD